MTHNPGSLTNAPRGQLYLPLTISLALAAWILFDPYFLTFIIFPYNVCVNCAHGVSIDLMIKSNVLPERFADLPVQLYVPPLILLLYSASWIAYVTRSRDVRRRLTHALTMTTVLTGLSIFGYFSLLNEYRTRLSPSVASCAKLIQEGYKGRANVELANVHISSEFRSVSSWRPDTLYTSMFGSKCEIVHLSFDENLKECTVLLHDSFLTTNLKLHL